MEPTSPQAFTEEEVTDIDIQFTTDAHSLTLYAEDSWFADAEGIHVTFGGAHTPAGFFNAYTHHILWYSVRKRTIQTPVKPFVPSGTGPEPTLGRIFIN